MNIESLEMQSFRNYAHQSITFGPGVNVIYGNNAQGKTNLLEALYLFAFGKSFRTTQERDLIRFGDDITRVNVRFSDRLRTNTIDYTARCDRKKQIKINGVGIHKLSELVGRMSVVLFYPEELNLIKEGPALRRRFLDIAISQTRPRYYHLLGSYNKLLVQRNHLIKRIKFGRENREMLPVWDEKLAEAGSALVQFRSEYIFQLSECAKRVHKDLTNETLCVRYRPRVEDKADFLQKLSENIEREIEHGMTLYGPHRDDMEIAIGDLAAKAFASQGQQRTCVLSLKIAQADLIYEKLGEYPVLLLDDIMSELDATRRQFLLERVRDKQVILTCTDLDDVKNEQMKAFYIESGNIFPQ